MILQSLHAIWLFQHVLCESQMAYDQPKQILHSLSHSYSAGWYLKLKTARKEHLIFQTAIW